jgi:transposase
MNSFFLGVDASKGYADFVILDSNKKLVEANFQLDDTFEGHCRLYERLQAFCEKHRQALIHAAVESTGGYENNWYKALTNFQASLNIKVAHLNPLGVSHNSRADLKRNVTDAISARNVAEYLIAHPEKVRYEHQDPLAGLRKQWRFISMLTKQCTQLLNQLESLVYNANPELLAYCKDSTPQWVFKVLQRYPTAVKLARARVHALARIPHVSDQRATQLLTQAKTSVASATDEITAQLVVSTVKQIMHLKQQINTQNRLMTEQCDSAQVELLKSFSGIQDRSAIGLMLHIRNIERFATCKKFAAFFGLHPIYRISGDGVGAFRMSKKGCKQVRQILYMVALNAVQNNALIREIYAEKVAKGMPKKAALGLCMHKIARILYGMLKHNRAFDPQLDQRNRTRLQRPGKVAVNKSRRYQNYDPNAPISRRQAKKRMEREQSHSDISTNCGIQAPVPMSG